MFSLQFNCYSVNPMLLQHLAITLIKIMLQQHRCRFYGNVTDDQLHRQRHVSVSSDFYIHNK